MNATATTTKKKASKKSSSDTATRPAKKKAGQMKPVSELPEAEPVELELRADFGNVTLGDGTASIRCTVDRGIINIVAADEGLCGKRLSGKLVLGTYSADQRKLFDDVDYEVEGSFDVKSLAIKPKVISFGLSFSIKSIDVEQLSHFAKKKGALIVHDAQPLDCDGDEDCDE